MNLLGDRRLDGAGPWAGILWRHLWFVNHYKKVFVFC
jgi:hypothetical protein